MMPMELTQTSVNELVYEPIEPIALCEYCGRPGYTEVHHIKTRGSGGKDIPLNKIRLCSDHHRAAQEYKIDRLVLVQIVAKREGVTPEEVCRAIEIPVPDKFPPLPEKKQEPGIEELIQAYISLEEQERESKWAKAQLLEAMLSAGAKAAWLASQLGISVSLIKKMVKTFKAFPEENMRVPELKFEHHAQAARATDPAKIIAVAADEQLSSRQIEKLINEQEAGEEIKSLIQDEEEKEVKVAKNICIKIEKIIATGGPAADYLKNKIRELIAS